MTFVTSTKFAKELVPPTIANACVICLVPNFACTRGSRGFGLGLGSGPREGWVSAQLRSRPRIGLALGLSWADSGLGLAGSK